MPLSAADLALAEAVIETAIAMQHRGINNAMSGNVSVRTATGMLITPSATAYDSMTPDDLVAMDSTGEWTVTNDRRPSSEWRFHHDIYAARPDATAIVHAHPVNATALACHQRGIEPFHYMVAIAGGRDIRCADYATFGTPELSANVVDALEGRKACLMANHGLVAVGRSLVKALDVAVEVEVLAAQYVAALAIGTPTNLTDAQMDEVLDKMSAGTGYGSS